DQHDGANNDTHKVTHAADHNDQDDRQRFPEAEAHRIDEALEPGEYHAGEAAERCRKAEGQKLHQGRVDADAARRVLVLADRGPAEAEDGAFEPPGEREGKDGESQKQKEEIARRPEREAEEKRLVDPRNSLWAIGHRDEVVHQEPYDLAEAERHDGE